ncbi:DISARM system helicase DrmA [Paenarthrobacter histidinolovorans]|uniref:DISARM system helicase DrmA n=1 Tax=Paenarthrobacter histidinolovorans TaxID=43664 RepID=UPI00166BC96E|nr:DISARM system helicase DrmA [Paenarthrobacter histidinolovorans]GGJ17951.1 helicase [Paenarthrobacter histidinolovorans]
MTVETGATGSQRVLFPEYELTSAPDGSSWTDRENLTDILERELLGPAHGDDELLDAQPDALYLVGRIAPAKLIGKGGVTLAEDAENAADEDVVPVEETDLGRGVPSVQENETAGSDDEGAEDVPLRRGLMIPASMGLRFQVGLDVEHVVIRAEWGTYRSEETDEVTPSGRQKRKFRRTQHAHPVIVPVGSLQAGKTEDFPLEDSILIRVDVMDYEGKRIVEAALCNDRETPRRIPVDAWLYQTKLYVEADTSVPQKDVFLPVTDILAEPRLDSEPELARLQLQYRDRLEFAIGRTCSVDWTVAEGARRATQVRTTWLPVSETPQTKARDIDGALLDMKKLDTVSVAELDAGLRPIVEGYQEWLAGQKLRAAELPAHLQDVAGEAIQDAGVVAKQLERGLDFLLGDAEALRCFRFMNRVTADQRVQSQVAELRASNRKLTLNAAKSEILAQGPRAHSWRTFQLAFVLMQLEALSRPELKRRSSSTAKAELLFFPTGGGKTEAYLGLAAFTFAVRRRQGIIDSADGRIDGNSGVAVLMRYTLRLLTAQQFQRATALVCAAEVARREDEAIWGTEPFRIGLWVGTAVSPKRYDEAAEQLAEANEGRKYGLTVLQLQRCPWCGTPIEPKNVKGDDVKRRIRVYCGDDFGDCPFSDGAQGSSEGLPVLTVDEEIYRLAPSFVIATVDKFARLAREGEAAALFGYVRKWCERHGYVHDDQQTFCKIDIGGKHPARNGMPCASVRAANRLRPPDLIIQDELHLITGALGTAVGAFELAVDVLTTWKDAAGNSIRPLVVASTATVRNAAEQIKALYGRRVTIFPPQVLDVSDTYFSTEVPVSPGTPGRRYIGISTTGVRLTSAEIVVASTLLSAGQVLLDQAQPPAADKPVSADPYMTLVGYFNATRELAGMARYVADDVQTAIKRRRPGKQFPARYGTQPTGLNVAELTSRVSSSDITGTLDQMGVAFDGRWDATAGSKERAVEARAAREAGKGYTYRNRLPYDVVLATSMLQVGVDVTRLGLMLMIGQPKNTAEYIQASSRVGRDASRPGLVVTLGNWARPRDLAHFEQFRHYHETFYSQVEPLSVTPYSYTSIDRSLDGVLVSAARVSDATRPEGLSTERSAWRVDDALDRVNQLIDQIVERANIAGGEEAAHAVEERLKNRRDQWSKRRAFVQKKHHQLVYEKIPDGKAGEFSPLLLSPETQRADMGMADCPPFVVANSMREVQPEINLLVTPKKENLMSWELQDEPDWVPVLAQDGESDD